MLNELKVVQDIWRSGGRASDEQLEALVMALSKKDSEETLEGLEKELFWSIDFFMRFEKLLKSPEASSTKPKRTLWDVVAGAFAEDIHLSEKRSRYFVHLRAERHPFIANSFYWLTFKDEIPRREFNRIMSEAKDKDNNYLNLRDKEFCEQHGIVSLEEFHPDHTGYVDLVMVSVDSDGNVTERNLGR